MNREKWTEKMTVRLFLLLITCGIMSICCFRYLMQWQTWAYVELVKRGYINFEPKKIVEEMQEKAKNISCGTMGEKELRKLLEVEKYDDGFTSIMFYDAEGKFLFYGIEPAVWDSYISDVFWYYDVSNYRMMDYSGELEFQDAAMQVMVYSMHQAQIVMPYFFAALGLSMLLFLPVLLYVWNRMRYVGKLKDEILVMADGDLEHPITVKGKDEIGVLARNLDEMRRALDENIYREQEGQKANHDLISSISHDLRTPMTTLYGYLEIMAQKKCPEEKREEYVNRCIGKVEEIRALSDKMFEYALVYEKNEKVELTEIFLWELLEEMESSQEFLRLKGFQVLAERKAPETAKVEGNRVFFQRIFNNLFSNILKYGEKEKPVYITTAAGKGSVEFGFLNGKKQPGQQVESNRIGLKSVQKMVELQGGSLFTAEEAEIFAVTIRMPLG